MKRFLKFMAIILAALGPWTAPSPWTAGLFSAGGPSDVKAPIEIVSDRLVANNAEKWADFQGAVTATQGKFSMTSDAERAPKTASPLELHRASREYVDRVFARLG